MTFLRFYQKWRHLTGRVFTELCRPCFRSFGRNSRLRYPIRLKGADRVAIGEDVFVGPNCWIEAAGAGADGKPLIEIGTGTEIAGFCTITSVSNVTIGPRVLIARYVYISDHSHEYRDPDVPIIAQGVRKVLPVRVEEGAWLGQGAVICPGVVIGRNAVVGANSVVISDVPDHCVAAGVPARIIRRIQPEAETGETGPSV